MCRFLVKTLRASPYAVTLASLLAASAVAASEVTIPHTFQANAPAVAAEVNANFGAVEVAVDDSASRIADLEATIASLQSTVNTLQNQMSALQSNSVLALDGALGLVTDPATGQPTARFTAVNVQVVNGRGSTASTNGVGNLIVGYNEDPGDRAFCTYGAYVNQQECEAEGHAWAANQRSGSHNLVVGNRNAYSLWGGQVAGYRNAVNGYYSTVNGGYGNLASGGYSAIGGGADNTANGGWTTVSGGRDNVASGNWSATGGGRGNETIGLYSVVSGGSYGDASGDHSSVSGGWANTASGIASAVSGGERNVASGTSSSVSGGGGYDSQYLISFGNEASGDNSSISGGRNNVAGGTYSSVSGGENRGTWSDSNGEDDWAAGTLYEDN